MRDHPNLTSDQEAAIKLLEKLLTEIPDGSAKAGWPGGVTAEEFAYDIIVGQWYEQNDKILAAKKRYENRKLGFEKCIQLAFNFKDDYTVDEIKAFITKFKGTTWKQLSRAKFCVEFFTPCDTDQVPARRGRGGKGYKWNPHIHCWIPHCPPAAVRQLAKRRFASDRVNVWVGPGNCNLLKYVLGTKRDSKEAAVDEDKKFRREHNFEECYEFSA